ncbi:NAD(P)-dependent oxidoreductase [Marinicella rhabdoformis]|uniref:NAD(P)-dependent oxidoreductase n=1 Tax=Marinicella rhabdoformis TaxID=2580566 RepID=UPI0012AED2CE|nr:NAD(P)-dependent oxidoreductase [Marinicella rhabdoformis]
MSIAVVVTDRDCSGLCQMIQAKLPGFLIQQWPNISRPDLVEFAVLWQHPQGITEQFKNLKAVTSLGAGTDHMDHDVALSGLLQLRIVTKCLKQLMAQYVLLYIMSESRHQLGYYSQQHQKQWQVLETEDIPTVGFIGLGALGGFVADRCSDLGFNTLAWTAQSEHPNHQCFHDNAGFKHVIEQSDFVVLLLPLTNETHHIINGTSLSWFKDSATLINVARGAHVDEMALCEALQNNQLKHAVLDVFEAEPLPAESPLWQLDNVTITPHVSARSDAQQTADMVVELFNQYVLGDSEA